MIMLLRITSIAPITLLISLAACGGSQGTHPEDMSAEDHRAMAEHERDLASEHEGHAGTGSEVDVVAPMDPGSPFIYGTDLYDPAGRHQGQAQHHQALAAEHAAAAEALISFENAQCAQFPEATRAACPLLGTVVAVSNTDGGVEITLAQDVNRDAVLAHIRCHLAFAATAGREGMPHCPLYMPGVSVSPGASDHSVMLTIADESQVDALRARTRAHVLGE